MLLSWWCPLGQGKEHLPARQFVILDRLIPILTHLSCHWTVPLNFPQFIYFNKNREILNVFWWFFFGNTVKTVSACISTYRVLLGSSTEALLQIVSIQSSFKKNLRKNYWSHMAHHRSFEERLTGARWGISQIKPNNFWSQCDIKRLAFFLNYSTVLTVEESPLVPVHWAVPIALPHFGWTPPFPLWRLIIGKTSNNFVIFKITKLEGFVCASSPLAELALYPIG